MKTLKKRRGAIGALLVTAALLPFKVMACPSDPYLGSICAFGGNFAIRSFAYANGQLLPISQYSALFSLYGTTYGGDGRTTFALPDLRGRAPIHWGQGPGLSNYRLGQSGGAETHTLNVNQIPSHSHGASTNVTSTTESSSSTATLRALAGGANTNNPTNAVLANSPNRENIYNTGVPTVDMSADAIVLNIQSNTTSNATTTVGNTGGNQAFNIRGPYLAISWQVALQGIFPSRS